VVRMLCYLNPILGLRNLRCVCHFKIQYNPYTSCAWVSILNIFCL